MWRAGPSGAAHKINNVTNIKYEHVFVNMPTPSAVQAHSAPLPKVVSLKCQLPALRAISAPEYAMVSTFRYRTWHLILTLVAAAIAAVPAAAQDAGDLVPPPFLSQLDGSVELVRNAEPGAALLNAPVLDGDRYAASTGRFAIQWPDGLVVSFEHGTTVDFQEPRSLRILGGQAIVLVPRMADTMPLRLVTRNAGIEFAQPGRYGVASDGQAFEGETLISVETGFARVSSAAGDLPIASGQQAIVRGDESPRFTAVNNPFSQTFEEWAAAAATNIDAPGSAGYLPPELQAFGGSLEQYGMWQYDSAAGYVWYPRAAADWRPFSAGGWVRAGRYGWFWVGTDAWAWPTHFYGGWGIDSRARWYWRPSSRWNAARVSWATSPGYVAWCPLDIHGRPLRPAPFGPTAALSASVVTDSGRAWITVPSHAFGTRIRASRVAIDTRTLAPAEQRAFTVATVPDRRSSTPRVARAPLGSWPARADRQVPAELNPQRAPTPSLPTGSNARTWTRQPQFAAPAPLNWERNAQRHDSRSNPRYDRPTPFVNPRWTSRPGSPDTVGLPHPGNLSNEPTWYVVGPPARGERDPRTSPSTGDRAGNGSQRGGNSEHRGGRGGRR